MRSGLELRTIGFGIVISCRRKMAAEIACMNHTNAMAGRANQHSPVARMERSAIRGRSVRWADSRITLRSIRATRYCVARRAKHPSTRSTRVVKNIPFYRNSETAHVARTPARGRGAYRDRHDTRAGRRWTQATSARRRSQGGAAVSDTRRAHDRCDRRTAKSCRPGARGLCAKSCGDVRCPTGRAHQPSAGRRGAIVHRSPGRARHKPFQPLRRERPGCLRLPCFPAVHRSAIYLAHSGSIGASRLPVFPCALFHLRG